MAARTAQIENLQLKVGQRLVGLRKPQELGLNVVDKFIPNMDNLNDKYKEQFSNVVKLDNEISFCWKNTIALYLPRIIRQLRKKN